MSENTGSVNLMLQLQSARMERALEAAEALADNRSLLTTLELERFNGILLGVKINEKTPDLWRTDPITITLPSGKTETLAIIKDPKISAREILHHATEKAENGDPLEAAIDTYVGLVLAHSFKDANRRTAVLAAHYFFSRYGIPLNGTAIHELGLGDLRDPSHVAELRKTIEQMAKFGAKR